MTMCIVTVCCLFWSAQMVCFVLHRHPDERRVPQLAKQYLRASKHLKVRV